MTTLPVTAEAAAPAASLPEADLFPVGRHPTIGFRLARLLIEPIVRGLFNVRAHGVRTLPDEPYVLIANHLNWLDSFAILVSLPSTPRIHFLGDPTILLTRRFQWWVVRTVGGYVPVYPAKHAGERLFDHVETCLEKGGVIALYPEAHYGAVDGGLDPLKKGFAHFAVRAQVPVVPVGLSGTKNLWWRKRIDVTVGEAIDVRGKTVEEVHGLGDAGLRAVLHPERRQWGVRLFKRKLTGLL
jgi:1-acyl-sn-glycerol-3-phosphate acyltransferase